MLRGQSCYDLQTDPFEQRNLYAENPRLAGLLRERIKQFEAPAPEARHSRVVGADHASRLAALGYVGTSSPARSARAEESWPDPKDTIQEYNATVLERVEHSAPARLTTACPADSRQ